MTEPVSIAITLLPHAVGAPAYATEHAAGMDLLAAIEGEVTLHPGRVEPVPTGVQIEIPPGYEGQVRGRSGLALRIEPGGLPLGRFGARGFLPLGLGARRRGRSGGQPGGFQPFGFDANGFLAPPLLPHRVVILRGRGGHGRGRLAGLRNRRRLDGLGLVRRRQEGDRRQEDQEGGAQGGEEGRAR